MTKDQALTEFAKWVIWEFVFEGCNLDGDDIKEKALKLGLLEEVKYDPKIHGETDIDIEPGDPVMTFSVLLKSEERRNDL